MALSRRGTPMAIACVSAVTLSLGAMYVMGRDTKAKEGQESTFKNSGPGVSDMHMNSSDVSATVSLPKPGKDRLHHQPDNKPSL